MLPLSNRLKNQTMKIYENELYKFCDNHNYDNNYIPNQ